MRKGIRKIIHKVLLVCVFAAFVFSCKSVASTNKSADQLSIGISGESPEVTRKKIKDAKNKLNLRYSKKREDFESDVVFANFRNVKMGNLKENILYRGASPIDNSFNRAKYADELIKSVNINYDVDLSDNEEKVKKSSGKKEFSSDYFLSLYNNKKVSLLHMTTDERDEKNHKKVVQGLIDMSKNEGPFYVHCIEGKHRTGFFCIVVEALVGATYEEMVDDFMLTFYNYCGITKDNNKEAYDIIKSYYIDEMLRIIAGISDYGVDLSTIDWINTTKNFLKLNGMTEEDLGNWYKNLTNQ